jgi:hypothetical protein
VGTDPRPALFSSFWLLFMGLILVAWDLRGWHLACLFGVVVLLLPLGGSDFVFLFYRSFGFWFSRGCFCGWWTSLRVFGFVVFSRTLRGMRSLSTLFSLVLGGGNHILETSARVAFLLGVLIFRG